MKTSMQELRCLVQSMLQNGGDDDLWAVLSHIDDKLEKEKEQIIEAYNQGTLDGESDIIFYPDYYFKTYNQNK